MYFYKFLDSRLLRYLLVGGVTAVVYFGSIFFLITVSQLDYKLGVSVAYLLAVSFHFFCNRRYTFNSPDSDLEAQVLRYIVALLVNYLITIFIISLFVEKLNFSTYSGASLSIIATMGFSYISSKFWVFKKKEASE